MLRIFIKLMRSIPYFSVFSFHFIHVVALFVIGERIDYNIVCFGQ